jgi:indolepyruvate ferredoxin oxidoreductase beta subunit
MKYQIVISGFGGQGIVFLVKLLALSAKMKGIKFLGTENHGMSQRGGAVRCDIKLGNFYSPVIDNAQADLLIGLDENETLRNLHLLKENGWVVANIQNKLKKKGNFHFLGIDANNKIINQEIPIEFRNLNIFILGAVFASVDSFPFSKSDIKNALIAMQGEEYSKNFDAFLLGEKIALLQSKSF